MHATSITSGSSTARACSMVASAAPPDGLVKIHLSKVQRVHIRVHDLEVEIVALPQVVANQCLAARKGCRAKATPRRACR